MLKLRREASRGLLTKRPTFEQIEREARTSRLSILPEKQKRTQQGILLDDVDFDEFDSSKYDIRNPNKAAQTDMFNEPSIYSSASSNRSVKTAIEGNEDKQQDRQVSLSSGESLDDVRYRTRMSIADDLATMARVGGNIIYYTGQGIGQGINMAIDAYNWMNEEDENEEPEPPIDASADASRGSRDEEVFEQTQGLMRRGASRSRCNSPCNEEQPSGSSDGIQRILSGQSRDAIRLLSRGASRSRSSTPKKGFKK